MLNPCFLEVAVTKFLPNGSGREADFRARPLLLSFTRLNYFLLPNKVVGVA
jgi:hypothetical protein